MRTEALKKEVSNVLRLQGYIVHNNGFYLPTISSRKKDLKRSKEIKQKKELHKFSRAERINKHIKFINAFSLTAEEFMLGSSELDITKIRPKLIEVTANSAYTQLYRWWNMVWWSLPYEKSYGRQMRFMVWDEYHNAPIGLIGLQSPILSWKVRDDYLGITKGKRDFWVNQSMNAQRLGALPPYNKFLGGKLIASLMTSDCIRRCFYKKYKDSETLLLRRKIPANLLFITTTGAYGKSSVYNRLKFDDYSICDFIGYTHGSGSFHIPDTLYESFISYLQENGFKAGRSFGNGPSVKIKNITKTMNLLGFKNGATHGIKRAVYLFPLAKNLKNVVEYQKKPIWHHRSEKDLTEYWQQRWAVKRLKDYPQEKLHFSKEKFVMDIQKDLENCKKIIM